MDGQTQLVAREDSEEIEAEKRTDRRTALLAAGAALVVAACSNEQSASDLAPLADGIEPDGGREVRRGSDVASPPALGFIDEETANVEGAVPPPPTTVATATAPSSSSTAAPTSSTTPSSTVPPTSTARRVDSPPGQAAIIDASLVRPVREDTAPLASNDSGVAGPVLTGPLTVDPFDAAVIRGETVSPTAPTTTEAPTPTTEAPTTTTEAPTTTTEAPTTTTEAPTTTTTAAPSTTTAAPATAAPSTTAAPTTTTAAPTTTTAAPVATAPTIADPTTTTTTTVAAETSTSTSTTSAVATTIATTTIAPSTTTAAPTTTTTTAAPTTTTTAAPSTTTAAPTTTTTAAPTTTTTEVPNSAPSLASARLLANRLTFAATPEIDQQILDLGLVGFIDSQLALNTADPEVEGQIANYLSLNPSLGALASLNENNRRLMDHEIVHMSVFRAVNSRHQLYEVLQRLWMDHFNTSFEDDWSWSAHYLEQVIRPNGMGSFHELLAAVAHSPAMLYYLDNAISNASSVNENYGRELLELHTLGIDDSGRQIYTEDDVVGVSHVMTGWSIDFDNRTFLFRSGDHSDRAVSILGGQWTNAGLSGKAAGDSLLYFLSHHPQTARHVCTKLIRRFVTDNAPESLISSAAAVYLANDTNVVPVLRHILGSGEFANSTGLKIRRPFEQIVATIRALGVELPTQPEGHAAERIYEYLRDAQHAPWRQATPDGYADVAEPWLSTETMLRRWEGVARVARNDWTVDDSLRYDPVDLRGATTTAGEVFDRLALRLNIGEQTSQTRSTLLGIIDLSADTPIDDVDDRDFADLLSFLVAHPMFQLR